MQSLIVGRFNEHNEAEQTANELRDAGFHPRTMCLMFVGPEGHHDLHPLGGDADESAGTHDSQGSALRGAAGGVGAGAIVGIATIPVLGPAGPLLGAAVGAYTGSLVGALNGMDKTAEAVDQAADHPPGDSTPAQPHQAGILLAVTVDKAATRAVAIELISKRASELEETHGDLQNGEWLDFDPARRPPATRLDHQSR